MNKIMGSVLSVGAGIVAYNYVQKNNLISNRQMRKLRKGIKGFLVIRSFINSGGLNLAYG